MSVVFDPFTGQIIDTGSSGGSPTIGGPVLGADPNAILVTDGATNLADIQLADGEVLIGKTGDAPVAATITGTPDQIDVTNGPNSITLSTPQDIATTSSPTFANLNLTPTAIIDVTSSGLLEIGVTNATTINIGNAGAEVNIYGDTVYQNVTNLNVTDKNITVNNGGSAYTSFNSGIHVYDGGVADKGFLEVTPDMLGWDMKAPYADGVIVFEPGSAGFTINQGSHDPVTIATPANGLAILNQELSIDLASASQNGALSSSDWSTFNNKQSAFAFKVQAYDPVNTTLPAVDPTIIDGYTVLNGDKVLFSNLTNPLENNKIYTAAIAAGVITWTEDTLFIPNVNDYVLVENGNAFAVQAGVFNGTSFDFNRVVRYFNGVDYFEQSAIYAVSLTNNSTNTVFTINVANSENMVVDYSILRGTNKTTGTLYITTDGVAAQVSDVGVNLYSPVGVSFIADIALGQITLSCNADNSGDNGELKYTLRRWSDAPGGPGGLPSYSGSGGSSVINIEEVSSVNPTVPFSNINTIQFDNDTGFNVTQPSPGTVKVSLGSTFKTWNIDNGAGPAQPSLVAVGEDTVEFVAGTNIEFVTDNTLGSKSFTINATGGSGPSVQTVTLANGASNQDVTGFVVDPLTSDAFSADIVIKREVPTGIVDKNPGGYVIGADKIIEMSDGSCILYASGGMSINKINAAGVLDTTFQTNANQFSSSGMTAIYTVIDVTEDISNQVFAVFGSFDTFQTLSRNNVCFIDGSGNDISDLYLNFGDATGSGAGISVSMASYSATKIKIPTAAVSGTWTASTRYGYLIQGVTAINGTATTSQLIVVSNEQSGGYIEVTDPFTNYPVARLLTPSDKSVGTCAFTYGVTTLPAISWTDAENFYYSYDAGPSTKTVLRYDFVSVAPSTVAVATAGFSPSPVAINSIAPNPDGSVLFIGGEFNQVDSVNNRSFAKIAVNSPTSFTFDSSFSPFYSTDPSAVVYKIIATSDSVSVGGYMQSAYPTNKNYLIYDYSGTINTSALSIFGNIFQYNNLLDFTNNLFIQSPPGSVVLYGYSSVAPAVYMTTIYGCYDESTSEMTIQGYTKSAGPYTGVDFSMTAAGQLKYTATNNIGGGPFTMKYRLETI
jgi:hypothetical protein